MEKLNYLAFAMPAFFLFVWLEYKAAQRKKRPELFKYESSVSNISIGIAERLLNLFVAASFYQLYYYVYDNYAIWDIPANWMVWIALILATDFVWYWYHRLGHEVNIFWAAHIVHHHSEEFNFTAAARITTIQAVIRTAFWCLLPLAGFHPTMVITMLLVHGAYSFFTHTQVVGRIKWLEYVFITPSLHGVHHASDEKYLDKNYGDMFVFWDKLFGTYQAEEEAPKYGLTHPLKSYSFLWQHFHYYFEIAESYRRANGFKAKWKAVFGSPAHMDQDIRPELEKKFLQCRSLQLRQLRFKGYLALQIALCTLMLMWFTFFFAYQDIADKVFTLTFILLTLVNCGALLEQRRWIYYLEYARLLLLSSYLLYNNDMVEYIFIPVALLFVAEKYFSLGQRYQGYILQTRS
ncbi:sterol desaturase [Flavobacterium akiainvivens]|uniref:Sterol desaturase n=1 Tax=Flavobacterium akiainvivens TaxID=1202724 RepID=A0A0M8MGH9_9FLAO|nr:sterol desaturase family protein [Flavobacterium akiainvivens]KOS05108.1 sterol desaturase [Flavobacterium akiainvivens]SFQ51573.1 Sterol desaturase/sphingolipid hydroxylase, fatty acid hydroxylase superfamily [Flavobacterium akiainvivens]